MIKPTNSLTHQLEDVNRLHTNGLKIFQAYLDAVTTAKQQVSVDIENTDGTTTSVIVPTNTFLGSELDRLRESLLNVSGLLNNVGNTIVSIDDKSSFREILTSTYKRTFDSVQYNELTIISDVNVALNAAIENLVSPSTNVLMQLPIAYISADRIRLTKFKLSNSGDIDEFASGQSYAETIQTLSAVQHTQTNEFITLEHRVNRYYGNFNVNESTSNDDNTTTLALNKLTYSDINNVVQDSRELQIGDVLITADGLSRLNVESADARNNKIIVTYAAGYEPVQIGSETLSYLYTDNNEVRTIQIPIKQGERTIMFMSVDDKVTLVESSYSESIVLDSREFTVIDGGVRVGFDEYFASKVTDIGGYFESFIRESNVPAAFGIQPDTPELQAGYFKVRQINKHLTDTPDNSKLNELNAEKQSTFTKITSLNTKISELNRRIAKGNYTSTSDKQFDQSELTNVTEEKNRQSSLYQSIVSDITAKLDASQSIERGAKYRARGFWPVQTDIESTVTSKQKIVQYDVKYRYLANNSDVTSGDAVSYVDNSGDNINGVISAWQEFRTQQLEKFVNDAGELAWSNNVVENSEQQNINQLDIPIKFGESVEIQVRAVSEAGYPIAPIKSAWSNIVRINFPEELLATSDTSAVASSNENDKIIVAVQKEFSAQGITEHVNTAITEQDKYFAHDARQISSGFLTSEQKIISLFDKIISMNQVIESLNEKVDRRTAAITVELIDATGRVYVINSFTTLNVFAGYYTDSVDITNDSQYGDVVSSVMYLRLNNLNAQTAEMLSISPGSLLSTTEDGNYANIPISFLNDPTTPEQQSNGQVVYMRNVDISGSDQFFIDDDTESYNIVPDDDIDTAASAGAKNVVHDTGSSIYETIALTSSASLSQYAVMKNTHPLYVEYVANGVSVKPQLDNEFSRIRAFNSTLRAEKTQSAFSESRDVAFNVNDKYLVGANTVGSRLFMQVSDISNIQVNGIDSGSIKQIHPGESNSVMIPIVFQYRMSDALGFLNGDTSLTQNTNFEYTKTVGIDMIIAGAVFKFDINVSAKFRPTAVSNNNLGISDVTDSIDTLSQTNPRIA